MNIPKTTTVTLHHCIARGEDQLECVHLESPHARDTVWVNLDKKDKPVEVLSPPSTFVRSAIFRQRLAATKQLCAARVKLGEKHCPEALERINETPAKIGFYKAGEVKRARARQAEFVDYAEAVLRTVAKTPEHYRVEVASFYQLTQAARGGVANYVRIFPKNDKDYDTVTFAIRTDDTVTASLLIDGQTSADTEHAQVTPAQHDHLMKVLKELRPLLLQEAPPPTPVAPDPFAKPAPGK